jgi:hypothetical protein
MRYTRVRAHETLAVLPLHGHDEAASAPTLPHIPLRVVWLHPIRGDGGHLNWFSDFTVFDGLNFFQKLNQRQKVPLEERKLVLASNYTLRHVGMVVKP